MTMKKATTWNELETFDSSSATEIRNKKLRQWLDFEGRYLAIGITGLAALLVIVALIAYA